MEAINAGRPETAQDIAYNQRLKEFREWVRANNSEGYFTRADAVAFLTGPGMRLLQSTADSMLYRESEGTTQWGTRRLVERHRWNVGPGAMGSGGNTARGDAPTPPAPTQPTLTAAIPTVSALPSVETATKTKPEPMVVPEVRAMAERMGLKHRKPGTRPGQRSSDQLDAQFLVNIIRKTDGLSGPFSYLMATKGSGMSFSEVALRLKLFAVSDGENYFLKPECAEVANRLAQRPEYIEMAKALEKAPVTSTARVTAYRKRKTEEVDRIFFEGIRSLGLSTPVIQRFTDLASVVALPADTVSRRLKDYAVKDGNTMGAGAWTLKPEAIKRAREVGVDLGFSAIPNPKGRGAMKDDPLTQPLVDGLREVTNTPAPTEPTGSREAKLPDEQAAAMRRKMAEVRARRAQPAPSPKQPTTHNRNITYTYKVDGSALTPLLWFTGIAGGSAVLALIAAAANMGLFS